jgi:hypothetical protein
LFFYSLKGLHKTWYNKAAFYSFGTYSLVVLKARWNSSVTAHECICVGCIFWYVLELLKCMYVHYWMNCPYSTINKLPRNILPPSYGRRAKMQHSAAHFPKCSISRETQISLASAPSWSYSHHVHESKRTHTKIPHTYYTASHINTIHEYMKTLTIDLMWVCSVMILIMYISS